MVNWYPSGDGQAESSVCLCICGWGQRKRCTLACLYGPLPECMKYVHMYLTVELLTCLSTHLIASYQPNQNVDYFEVESFDLLKSLLCSVQANARVLQGQLLSLSMLLLHSSFVLSALSLLFSLSSPFLCLLTSLSPSHPAAATALFFALYNDLDHVLTTQGTIRFCFYADSILPSAMRWTCGSCMV